MLKKKKKKKENRRNTGEFPLGCLYGSRNALEFT